MDTSLAISTAAATQSQKLARLDGVVVGIVWSGAAVFILAFFCGGYWLVQANRPRATRTTIANRFSFPNVAETVRVTPFARQETWANARDLSGFVGAA